MSIDQRKKSSTKATEVTIVDDLFFNIEYIEDIMEA